MELFNFIKKEPLGFDGSMNFYSYCEGDPVNFIDVSGLYSLNFGDNIDSGDGSLMDSVQDIVTGVLIFLENYLILYNSNWIGADKYYHCRANCQTVRVLESVDVADSLSRLREWLDSFLGDSVSACESDMEANKVGQQGGMNSEISCEEVCEQYRPNNLPFSF